MIDISAATALLHVQDVKAQLALAEEGVEVDPFEIMLPGICQMTHRMLGIVTSQFQEAMREIQRELESDE